MGDPNLKTLLRRHTASAFFMSGMRVVMAVWRRAKKQETTPGVWRENGWTHNLGNFMKTVVCGVRQQAGDGPSAFRHLGN